MRLPILVTGSSGVLGTAVCVALEARGEEVLRFDVAARSAADQGDVLGRLSIQPRVRGWRGVVHLAGVSCVAVAEVDPKRCMRVNVVGTEQVVTAAEVENAWMVFTSSREVYGNATLRPVAENAALQPINTYGRSKMAAEALVASVAIRAVSLRLSNVYGSRVDIPERVVPTFARRALRGAPLRLDGAARGFDFLHIDDAVSGILAAIDALDVGVKLPCAINLCSGVETTLSTLGRTVLRLAGRDERAIECGECASFEVRSFVGDRTLARERLGWEPKVELEDGLRRLLQTVL